MIVPPMADDVPLKLPLSSSLSNTVVPSEPMMSTIVSLEPPLENWVMVAA